MQDRTWALDTSGHVRTVDQWGERMPQKHLMIAIDWYGPYPGIDEARHSARDYYDHGLYLAIGGRDSDPTIALQYVGIGERLHTRLVRRHHALPQITRDCSIWLGEVVTAEPSGARVKFSRATLDYGEWLHARFLRLPLNQKKSKRTPTRSVTVLNRWWGLDGETPAERPHEDWPDLIDYPTYGLPARCVWFGERQRVFNAPDYAEPKPEDEAPEAALVGEADGDGISPYA